MSNVPKRKRKKKDLFRSFLCGGAQLTHTSMYLHTHTVLYTLWVECKHTFLCMYAQTQPHTQLRLVRGKKCVFLFFCFSLTFSSWQLPAPSPLPHPRPRSRIGGLGTSTAGKKQRILGLVHYKNQRKTLYITDALWCLMNIVKHNYLVYSTSMS